MKKTLLTILCTVLVCSCVMGVTLAFLVDKTDPIVNTFTIGNIKITLTETANLDLKMMPGKIIAKDPTVTVKAGSEACYLFVKIDESTNLDTYIEYSVDTSKWTELQDGVYYIKIADTTSSDTPYAVLADNAVTVKTAVTQAQLEAAQGENAPKLTFTAYAVQLKNGNNEFSAADAWVEAQNTANYPTTNPTT